jgi:hypothetical protein
MSAIEYNEGMIIRKRDTHANIVATTTDPPGTMIQATDMNNTFYIYDGTRWRALSIENEIPVNKKEDFPNYASGDIIIPANSFVTPVGNFDIGSKNFIIGDDSVINGNWTLQLSGQILIGKNVSFSGIVVSVGTGTIISASDIEDGFLVLKDIAIICGASGTFFSASSTSAGSFIMRDAQLIGAATIGSLNSTTFVFNTVNASGYAGGLSLSNINAGNMTAFGLLGGTAFSGNLLDVSGTNGNLDLNGCVFTLNAAPNQYAMKFTGTYNGVKALGGLVSDSSRAFAPTTTYDNQSVGFKFRDMNGVSDTDIRGYGYFKGNSPETEVTDDNTWYKINAAWTEKTQKKITVNSSGRFTYIGNEKISKEISSSAFTLDPVSGAASTWEAGIGKNGTVIADSSDSITILSGETAKLFPKTTEELSQNDYIEFFVRRTGGAGNVVVTNGDGFV